MYNMTIKYLFYGFYCCDVSVLPNKKKIKYKVNNFYKQVRLVKKKK